VSNLGVGGETVAVQASAAEDEREPILAISEGWVIDDLARERLSRQLAQAPDQIRGVVAETGALPSGSSYRVHAELQCLRPFSVAAETRSLTLRGAVLLRPGVAFETREGFVEVEDGPLFVDPGAHVHDPWREVTPLQDASALGRPPFPRRPVVVFLACEPEFEALDWARALVNNLVRRDVEGRLAMLDAAEGLQLTQPCLPSEESIRALEPDVIVALDRPALGQVPAWCGTNRSTVAVEFTPDVAATTELVAWQLGSAQGRLRARIGRQVDAPTLVSLINRLCSGPHPSAPSDTVTPAAAVATVRKLLTRRPPPIPEPAARRTVMVVTDVGDSAGNEALGGLVDHLVGAGHAAQMCAVDGGNASAVEAADVVVVGSPHPDSVLTDLMEARLLAGRPTIANIEPPDGSIDMRSPDEIAKLAAAPAIAAACSGVMTRSTAVYELLRGVGVHAHLLPTLLTREAAARLRSARGRCDPSSEHVLGWDSGSVGTPVPDYVEAVTDAVLEMLAEWENVIVETVGEPSHIPARLLPHPRVSALSPRPGPEALSRWTLHLWSPPVLDRGVADDTRAFMEASAVGVPTVLPKPAAIAIGGYPSGLMVEQFHLAEAWIAQVRSLLDEDNGRSRQSREATHRFDAMHGSAAADAAVNRFLGWALSTGGQL
jgi:hypothetical protein